jgi:hypothetical protein
MNKIQYFYSLLILVLILSCRTRTYNDLFIQEENENTVSFNGWTKETFKRDEFGRGDSSKIVIYKKYLKDTLIKYIEFSSFQRDTTKVAVLDYKDFTNNTCKIYTDVWQGEYKKDIRLTHTYISLTPKTIDSAYFYYRDRSIKRLRYGDKTDSTDFTNINYQQGTKFVNMARFDSLPGVKEENGYFVFVDE